MARATGPEAGPQSLEAKQGSRDGSQGLELTHGTTAAPRRSLWQQEVGATGLGQARQVPGDSRSPALVSSFPTVPFPAVLP